IADGAMRPILVVVSAPILQFFLRIGKRQEPVGTQAFGPEAPIERFDERVVRRLARSREVKDDVFLLSPKIKVARYELGAPGWERLICVTCSPTTRPMVRIPRRIGRTRTKLGSN